MLYSTSFVDEVSRPTLAPYASFSDEESYQSRDLEKVANLVSLNHVGSLESM